MRTFPIAIVTLITPIALTPGAPGQDPADLGAVYRKLSHARASHLDRLRAYTRAGRYPRNTGFPGRRVPCFVDDRGTRCAVGELMWHSGCEGAVREIARADNHVLVMDVREGPLLDWVLGSGLTQEECAEIQPSYEFYFHQAETERRRIHAHLSAVEKRLRERSEASLGVALRSHLDQAIDTGKLTRDHAPALLQALGHFEPNVRIGAIHAIARLGIDAEQPLIGRLRDDKREVRFWAAAALIGSLPAPSDPAPYRRLLTVFRDVLQNGGDDERMLAVCRIGDLARGAQTLPGERKILLEIRAALQPLLVTRAPDEAGAKVDLGHLGRWMLAVADERNQGVESLAHGNVGRILLELQAGNETHAAALHLRPEGLRRLLASDQKRVRDRNRYGETPLHLAARFGWTQVNLLLEHHADLRIATNEGRIPLHGSIWPEVKGDVKARDRTYRWTPLHYAAHNGRHDLVEALLERGADPNARDRFGFTPLHVAVGCESTETEPARFGPRGNHWLLLRPLLGRGADPSLRDARGHTPRWWAEKAGLEHEAEVLRRAGG